MDIFDFWTDDWSGSGFKYIDGWKIVKKFLWKIEENSNENILFIIDEMDIMRLFNSYQRCI